MAVTVVREGEALRWYFDVISPFTYLQWPKVKALAARRHVVLVPVVLAAILTARGQKGPAEIPGKREFSYRHVLWQARAAGVSACRPCRSWGNNAHAFALAVLEDPALLDDAEMRRVSTLSIGAARPY